MKKILIALSICMFGMNVVAMQKSKRVPTIKKATRKLSPTEKSTLTTFIDKATTLSGRKPKTIDHLVGPAFILNRPDIIPLLLKMGLDQDTKDEAIVLASLYENRVIKWTLCEAGASLTAMNEVLANIRDCLNEPLVLAAKHGCEAIVKKLLDEGANGNAVDRDYKYALRWAGENGYENVCNLLMDRWDNSNDASIKQDISDQTLEKLREDWRKKESAILNNFKKSLRGTLYDKQRAKPLDLGVAAVAYERADILRLLLNKGLDPNSKDEWGCSFLVTAARKGLLDIVKVLLQRGANPDAWDTCDGLTALMWSIEGDHTQIAQMLIETGANPSIKVGNETALSIARKKEHADMVGILETANEKYLRRS